MKNPYRQLEKAIGYRFKKKALLELALTHRSFRYENPGVEDDNQRLEYLGDAVLGLIAAEHLFGTSPDAREGDLSKLRSRLTQDRKLAQVGRAIGLGACLRLGRGEEKSGGAERASNIADAVEAIIGAAWLDGGARAVHRIFRMVFLPELDDLRTLDEEGNPKGELQEFAQKQGCGIPAYDTIDTAGPEHDRTFTVQVYACGSSWQASAGSKREAERKAASMALAALESTVSERGDGV